MYSLESPHRDDSNEHTQYTIFNINHPKLSQICTYGILSKGLKNEFETAMVHEPSVFEPLKVYCILSQTITEKTCTEAQTDLRLIYCHIHQDYFILALAQSRTDGHNGMKILGG